jgi:hypothetical protein
VCFSLAALSLLFISASLQAAEQYHMTFNQINEDKAIFDDPTPYYKKIGGYKNVLPDSLYDQLTFDKKEMSRLWMETVGFKAPDVVGKIAPEIKPGKYTVTDKAQYPFKELMPPHYYNRFNPPGAQGVNHIGNFTEIEVIPTRQYYYATPIARATMENRGKPQLNDQGYLQHQTFTSGFPFPKPSGQNKAWQIIYNYKKNHHDFETNIEYDRSIGIGSNFREDMHNHGKYIKVWTKGRLVMPPLGYWDKTAKKMGENEMIYYTPLSPRDEYGNVYGTTVYSDPLKGNRFFVYMNVIRRIRKMSASDNQDQSIGSDQTYDDTDGIAQRLRPDVYPYEIKILADREFLVPAATLDGKQWMNSKEKYKMEGLKFERRPMWVLEMKQLDPNYIYSTRIVYLDKETLDILFIENYDQKGRLYRTYSTQWAFIPEMGVLTKFNDIMLDHIDIHSTFNPVRYFPAPWLTRKDISIRSMMKTK